MEGGDSGGGGREGGLVLGLLFCSEAVGVVVHVRGRSFLFMVGVVVSWALVISEWGVVVVCGGPLLSLGIVIGGCGHCSWGWAVVSGRHVIVCGWWVSLRGTRLSFGGGRCRLWVPHCCS